MNGENTGNATDFSISLCVDSNRTTLFRRLSAWNLEPGMPTRFSRFNGRGSFSANLPFLAMPKCVSRCFIDCQGLEPGMIAATRQTMLKSNKSEEMQGKCLAVGLRTLFFHPQNKPTGRRILYYADE